MVEKQEVTRVLDVVQEQEELAQEEDSDLLQQREQLDAQESKEVTRVSNVVHMVQELVELVQEEDSEDVIKF